MCEELMVDIAMESNDRESSILTCSPKKLDEKYLYYLRNYPGYIGDTNFKKRLKQFFL